MTLKSIVIKVLQELCVSGFWWGLGAQGSSGNSRQKQYTPVSQEYGMIELLCHKTAGIRQNEQIVKQ